ncbi:transmembrane protein 220-like [Triplophysa rosa]|uniref:transmembrane protein 220-like n=1 Tax=Triplophysa rosa TaxID=992332 RepID=UPI0025462B8E|nr:transmembrane protein 220-like [Triplophysa rosa]
MKNMDDKDADLFSFRTKPSSAPVQRKEEVKEEPYIVPDKSKTLETLLWRRIADLHVLVASTFVFLLGWNLYKEKIINIFQQEEGREFSGLLLTVFWLLMCRHSGRGAVGSFRLFTAVGITVFPFIAWIYYYINTELRSHWPEHCTTAI